MTEASQGARSVWAGHSLEAQNLRSGLCCVSVEVASGQTGTLERVSRDWDCPPPIPSRHGFYLYTPAHHVPSPWHHSAPWVLSGVASVPGKSPADSSLGRPQSSLTRPQHEPSTETLCTPLTCSCLPPPTVRLFLLPRIHHFLDASLWSPVSLAMEPRLPDLASVSLGEGWGGLLEPLKRERLGSCGFHSHLGLE